IKSHSQYYSVSEELAETPDVALDEDGFYNVEDFLAEASEDGGEAADGEASADEGEAAADEGDAAADSAGAPEIGEAAADGNEADEGNEEEPIEE
ncbi:MAG: hypothetical protein LBR44_01705, partial [Clostridiales Family XIII bacterium]|nr:hypothetical protein [Clostridiales Family XIII bacterium]